MCVTSCIIKLGPKILKNVHHLHQSSLVSETISCVPVLARYPLWWVRPLDLVSKTETRTKFDFQNQNQNWNQLPGTGFLVLFPCGTGIERHLSIKKGSLFVLFVMLRSPKPHCPTHYAFDTVGKLSTSRGAWRWFHNV